MNHINSRLFLFMTFGLGSLSLAMGQAVDSPTTRLRPIGSPSAVDRYRSSVEPARYQNAFRETAYDNDDATPGRYDTQVRQAQFEVPPLSNTAPARSLPLGNAAAPGFPVNQGGAPLNPGMINPGMINRGQPLGQGGIITSVPGTPLPTSLDQNRDYAPMTQPRLNNQFATIDNSCCVTGPSSYTAASAPQACVPVSYQAPLLAPAGTVQQVIPGPVNPVVVPGGQIGVAPIGPAAGVPAGALISFGQKAYPVQVGQGIFGQPVAYVPGQRFRNWLRYIFP